MLTYYQRFPPSAGLLSLYKRAVDEASADLHTQYRRKVLAEFVRAAKEIHERAGDVRNDAGDGEEGLANAAQTEGEGGPVAGDEEDNVVDAVRPSTCSLCQPVYAACLQRALHCCRCRIHERCVAPLLWCAIVVLRCGLSFRALWACYGATYRLHRSRVGLSREG